MAPAKGWTEKRLDEIAEIEREIVSPEAIQAGTRYVGLEHIDGAGDFVGVRTVANGDLASAKFRFTRQHVLFGKLRPYLRKIARPDFEGVCSTDILPILPKPGTDRGFLFHYLRHPRVIEEATLRCEGANLPRLSPRQLETFPVSVPFKAAEQKRIAAILDRADAIRRRRHEASRLTDDLIPSLFYDMFGNPIENPRSWPTEPLGDLCDIRRGSSPRPINDYLGGDVPWIKIGDGTKGDEFYIASTEDFVTRDGAAKSVFVEPGSLIVANSGVSLGFARIMKIGGCIHDGWLSLSGLDTRFNKIFALKLINALTHYLRAIAPSGTQPNLTTTIMKELHVPVPPRPAQDQFEKLTMRLQALIEEKRRAGSEADDLFNSLVQRAFRGEL